MQESTSKENLFEIVELLGHLNIQYWIDGGWGVDLLLGKQSRIHRDVDVDYDSLHTKRLLNALKEKGYAITTDWSPTRIELFHPALGYIDIHPLVICEDGSAKQAGLHGDWYEFQSEWFTSTVFEGREIPCISAQAQKLFHSGYELREVDRIDLKNLETLL
ncbi:nucleotidyltransferase domain-containing protein [Anaeromassilibacillus senegalensis]|uniref:nucleotidyltransferase domain-containing protein n=1 Tax=Anaeromassilibacillus senegalensis TaxID=1673717 RepID=UPI000681DB06|nr:aminoglycoside-2'-adenylyltransferase [Anaeromassilibacillus senegalensis]